MFTNFLRTKVSIVDKIAFLLRRNIRNFQFTYLMLDTHLLDISGAKDFFEYVKERVVVGWIGVLHKYYLAGCQTT